MTRLYAFGSNGGGQLGIGHMEDTNTPTECLGLPSDDPIVKVTGGGNHSAVITQQGHLYMAGISQHGETSEQQQPDISIYTRQLINVICRDVVCGWAFTIVLTDTGELYGIGTSRWNELTRTTATTDGWIRLMTHHDNDDSVKGRRIVSVACGWRHCVALDDEGSVYGWGWGRHGQLGPANDSMTKTREKRDVREVSRIDLPQPIEQVACGHVHTLLRGRDGTVYGFGSNKYGQLEIPAKVRAVWIDAGWHHSALLDHEGQLTLFGRNDHGQLTKKEDAVGSTLGGVDRFVCGSEHMVAIKKDDVVVAWGWNEHGNCTSSLDCVLEPLEIANSSQQVKVIGAGCATTWFGC
ncbi:MAG: regulator of chromosome condensation 1/beta-lactamase-inhibitor protein II [Benjaminiella poitrasii]|nr:MAG: regulator of chromosome condensation 1/beta-lactamase-inhibitor protein II [Benjaminiella poitrasii]